VRNIAKSEKVSKKEGSADAFDKYAAHWAQLDKRFQFLQALGPAVGFILTVSSLVEALHPALLTANDLDAFLKGIHVAMIATFVGLLLRLVALEAARVNDKLLARADTLLALPQDE
jgi:biopolymer transport protein ExbB/TolQ